MGGDRSKTLNTLGDVTGILGGALTGAAQGVDSRRGGGGGGTFAAPTSGGGISPVVLYVGGGVVALGLLYAITR